MTKSRKLSARELINDLNDRPSYACRISSSTFVSKTFATATAEIRKIDEQSQKRVACSTRFDRLHSRFFKFYFLKQIVTRKRAYPIGDCDNLPGPTYLLTNIHTRKYATYPT